MVCRVDPGVGFRDVSGDSGFATVADGSDAVALQPVLEDLTASPRCPTEASWRNPGRAVEGAYKIGEIAEPDLQCDVGDRPGAVGQHSRRPAQTGTDQVLVRGDAKDFSEEPQEVKRADPHPARRAFEIDRIARMSVDPERGFHRAAAIAR